MSVHKRILQAIKCLVVVVIAGTVLSCTKAESRTGSCLAAKWQLVAKSSDGNTWQAVSLAETYLLDFSPNGVMHYSDKNTSCTGTYTNSGEELLTDLSACSVNIFFSHKIMQQSTSTLVLRPNSGAILPYTKYNRVY
jgi:hypothetical protein